jgi:hypothetical protein
MKVLFLNPHVGSEHALVKALQAKGYALLLPGNSEEAWQMLQLHGTSVDLAVIHREDALGKEPEQGFKFLAKIKKDRVQSELPTIITSQKWGDAEFAAHQSTPQGANAYLKWPFTAPDLIHLVKAVFGGQVPEVSHQSSAITPPAAPSKSSIPPQPKVPEHTGSLGHSSLVLEDASGLFMKSGRIEKSDTSIKLEAPHFEPDEPLDGGEALIPTAHGVSLDPLSQLMAHISESAPRSPGFADEPGTVIELSQPEEFALETSGFRSETPPEAVESDAPAPPSEGNMLEEGLSVHLTAHGALEPQAPEEPSSPPESHNETVVDLRNHFQTPEPTVVHTPAQSVETSDPDAAQEMPYLFQPKAPGMAFAQALGDAVVPGGAAHSPDSETLKKYLLLREQDVAVLSTQLKSTKDQLKNLEDTLREERARSAELTHVANEQKRKIEDFERDKNQAMDSLNSEVIELKFQLKARSDKARLLETQVREATDETERLKERVRADIRKIRVREKELENRLEIMKKDSEALISARESKIIELKRKLDLLEFNMDLLQDQHAREKDNSVKLRERLAKAAQVVRVAGGLLDSPGGAAQLAAVLTGDDQDAA